MLDFTEYLLVEDYYKRLPEECLKHAIKILQSSRDPRNAMKSIAILSLYAVLNATTDYKTRVLVPALLSKLTEL